MAGGEAACSFFPEKELRQFMQIFNSAEKLINL
jgi:hypothetical protein